jgi:hypothetical protein
MFVGNEHTDLRTSVTDTFLDFGTEEYIRVIFLNTDEYIKIEKDTIFSYSKSTLFDTYMHKNMAQPIYQGLRHQERGAFSHR